jgi:hypothetical protein
MPVNVTSLIADSIVRLPREKSSNLRTPRQGCRQACNVTSATRRVSVSVPQDVSMHVPSLRERRVKQSGEVGCLCPDYFATRNDECLAMTGTGVHIRGYYTRA